MPLSWQKYCTLISRSDFRKRKSCLESVHHVWSDGKRLIARQSTTERQSLGQEVNLSRIDFLGEVMNRGFLLYASVGFSFTLSCPSPRQRALDTLY